MSRPLSRRALLVALGALPAALGGCGGSGTTPSSPTAAAGQSTTGLFPGDGAQLHYQLDLPEGRGPFPAVVFGHGSGQVTKADGGVHVPFWLGQGFAVLRYDKRGAGQSTGTYRGVSVANSATQIAELAGDMTAGVAFLRTRPDIDSGRIGLTGVSQAGWVMAAATAATSDVRFLVAFVGSLVPIGLNVTYENLRDRPIDDAYAELARYAGPTGWDPAPALRAGRAAALYLFAADDRLVPTRVCTPLVDTLRGSGVSIEAQVYSAVGHELGSSTRPWDDVAAFLRRQGLR